MGMSACRSVGNEQRPGCLFVQPCSTMLVILKCLACAPTSMKSDLWQQHDCRHSTAIWAGADLNHVRAECQA